METMKIAIIQHVMAKQQQLQQQEKSPRQKRQQQSQQQLHSLLIVQKLFMLLGINAMLDLLNFAENIVRDRHETYSR